MDFEWDNQKAILNLKKHHISFQVATKAFFDPNRIEVEDDTLEERYQLIGSVGGRLLFVVYTWRGEQIRLISARKATHYERQQYDTYNRYLRGYARR